MTSLVAQMVKRLPTMRETQIQYLVVEGLLEKEMATHSSIFAWEILWTEKPRLQSMGSQRVGHDLATKLPHQQRWLKTSAWWQVHRAVGLCCSETRRRMCARRPCLEAQQ